MLSGMPHIFTDTNASTVLILAWETTVQATLRNALIDSRAFFRDLADSAGDFIWATDSTGKFSYTSPSGIGEMTAAELHGRYAVEMFNTAEFDASKLFGATEAIKDYELWIEAGGAQLCFSFSAEPIYDKSGQWSGSRGVGRNITELKHKEAELARIRSSEALINQVLQAIRAEADPQAMLTAAANAVVLSSALKACWIFRRADNEDFSTQNATIIKAAYKYDEESLLLDEADIQNHLEGKLAYEKQEGIEWSNDQYHVIATPASRGGKLLGIVCFFVANDLEDEKPKVFEEYLSISRALAHHITDQVATAIALAEQHEHLKILSRTDSLTSLLNRRAFSSEVKRRLDHHKRTGRTAALLYIDLDNFKDVNDTLGHAIGDDVLCTIAQIIKTNTRQSDIVARLGGDEFVVWLEETDETSAELKANDLIEQCQQLSELLAASNIQEGEQSDVDAVIEKIGMSVGIAIFNPSQPESLESLINRADSALYQAKANGKHGFRLAPALGVDYQDASQVS
jgi:diguanylate cyclase (GGDEF)-like protein/PAS domain S-box-containing protein